MKVIGTQLIDNFIKRYPVSRKWLKTWLAMVRDEEWDSPNSVKELYPSVSILDGNRLIFNVKGNHYRMEVQVAYKNRTLIVLRLGTHDEYDRWDT